MTFFKVFLSLDQFSELYDATWRKLFGAGNQYWCNRLANRIAVTRLQNVEGTGGYACKGPEVSPRFDWSCQPFSASAMRLTPTLAKRLGSFLAGCPHFLLTVGVTPVPFVPYSEGCVWNCDCVKALRSELGMKA